MDELRVRRTDRPGDAECLGRALQLAAQVVVRLRQRAQDADLAVHHQVGGGHPGQQRDLRVPALDRQRGAELQRPLAARGDDLLVGNRQIHTAAFELALLAELADLAEQLQRLRRRTGVEVLLHPGVVELRARLHQRAFADHFGAFAGGVDGDRPQQRGPYGVRQQRRGALGQLRRVQRRALVRRVQRLAAPARLEVDRVTGLHERRDVRDRVVHGVAVAGAFDVQGLVEVHRVRRVDRDELDVGPVQLRQPRVLHRRQRGRGDLGRELGRDLELAPDGLQRSPEHLGHVLGEMHLLQRHSTTPSSTARAPRCGRGDSD
jgi:hypothetical protein